MEDLTEEEIQARLAGESLKGPRTFRGRPLAPLSKGLRDLVQKVVHPEDTTWMHDVALIYILTEAYCENEKEELAHRRQLLLATDDIPGFRAIISLHFDKLSKEEVQEARKITNDLLEIIEKAEVVIAEKKSEPTVPAALNPTKKRSRSGASRAKPAGKKTTSSGG